MEVADADDGELVRRIALGGDARAAEAELCRRLAPRARLYGLRHLRDEAGAQDLAQSVVVVTLVAIRAGSIGEPDLIGRFMLGACRNIARRMRETEARAELVDPVAIDVKEMVPAPEPLDRRALSECLSKLDQRAYKVVMASFNAGAPSADIAGLLGMTVANVRVVRHRALSQLRDCIKGAREAQL